MYTNTTRLISKQIEFSQKDLPVNQLECLIQRGGLGRHKTVTNIVGGVWFGLIGSYPMYIPRDSNRILCHKG